MDDKLQKSPKEIMEVNDDSSTDSSSDEDTVILENASSDSGVIRKMKSGNNVRDENCSKSKKLKTETTNDTLQLPNQLAEQELPNLNINPLDLQTTSPTNNTDNSQPSNQLSEQELPNLSINPSALQTTPPNIPNNFRREHIRLNNTLLYPEVPSANYSAVDKPSGCKTVFVGGLPLNISKSIIKEIFGRCGPMQAVFIPEKGFCYITFCDESSVDRAADFSGYRIYHLQNKETYTGILFVDYATSDFDEDSTSDAEDNNWISSRPNTSFDSSDEERNQDDDRSAASSALFFKEMNDKIKKLRKEMNSLQNGCRTLQNNIKIMKGNFKENVERLDFQIHEIKKEIKDIKKMEQCKESDAQVEPASVASSSNVLTQDEAFIVAHTSVYLLSHPGETLNSIYFYLNSNFPGTINYNLLEATLQRFPSLFTEKIVESEDGSVLMKQWYYIPSS